MSTLPTNWNMLPLAAQLANIGSEVHRASRDKEKHPASAEKAFHRALELFDATLANAREQGALKEIARAREVVVDAWEGGASYGTSLAELDPYFLYFGIAARNGGAAR
jgi:hypothetical protein